MNRLIDTIQKQFLQEALNSPILLSDLASMETYIAESYQERSLVELLQNADDALAKKFIIKQIGNTIIVGNNGRAFTDEDVISICRSGSSTKQRNSKTIGYRGIGFKSVVNLGDRVHIISSELKMTFSRELTINLLQSDIEVPLIRIPHKYTPLSDYNYIINDMIENKFTTLFIFENCKLNNLVQEIEQFDSSSLLFLKSVRQVEFYSNTSKIITVDRSLRNDMEIVKISEDGKYENWLTYYSKGQENKVEVLAFLLNENTRIIPLQKERSVVHSFMPTKDFVGLPLKINGDFSTDPSRTKVTYDELTQRSLQKCSELIISIIQECLNSKENNCVSDIFNVLCELEDNSLHKFMSTNKFKDIFINELKQKLNEIEWFTYKDKYKVPMNKLKVNPEWLNKIDFLKLCEERIMIPLDKSYESQYPGIINFARKFGAEEFTVIDALRASEKIIPSIKGGVEILLYCLKKYRYNFDEQISNIIKDANLIKFTNGFISLRNITKNEKIHVEYIRCLNEQSCDFNDLKWFFKRLNIDYDIEQYMESENNEALQEKKNDSESLSTTSEILFKKTNTTKVSFTTSISRWRSAETNLAYFLEMESTVKKVIDVSKSNLGYDLEVHRDNCVEYVEVKSIENTGAAISLTNNEYSTANEYKNHYILAIVKQSVESLEVCFIKNPIETLNLIKRVTRWEWICDNYSGVVKEYKFEE
ncbi:sacsin N-terminal ATP-binding-like domain-containing protein [Clostridium sp.]|uniref:sacsin N-terminal ATP-binding-like domain-containing protein n=1 Tax=Clostridium sp. TaxID=1506 RepID=UPI00285029EB|nr:DUF3883 domain-containing protein [Clostridium sp.]MDR3597058.1 DUF3883 domain-containing protein [Clostridium sp.]